MKNIHLWAVPALALMLVACGGSKKAAGSSDYQYRQWQEQQQQQQESLEQQQSVQKRPARTLRESEPCIELAEAESEFIRAYGTATSYLEKVALNEARRDARNNLAQMIRVAVEGAAQDYEQNANHSLKNSAETLGESVMTQFVAEEIQNARPIKTSIYDLEDGTVQVYVCLEMRINVEEFGKKLDNVLDKEEIIGIQYDRDRFVKKTADGLEDYKKRNRQQ